MNEIPESRFNLGDIVYHATPDSPQGIVLNARFSVLENLWEYMVTFGTASSLWYYSHELSNNKRFI